MATIRRLALAGLAVTIAVSCAGGATGEEAPGLPPLPEGPFPEGNPDDPPVESVEETGLMELERVMRTQVFLGDLDEILERGVLRVLVPYNRTFFFYDGAQPRGLAYEFMEKFAEQLRSRQKQKRIRLTVVYLPVARDRLISNIAEGYGDIAIAGLTATKSREELVDFVTHRARRIAEVIVTGPTAPPLDSVDELSGKEVFVRESSSYYESLEELNRNLRSAGKPEVRVVPADENLEVEDILELVRTGVEPITVVDDYLARFWSDVMEGLVVREDLVLREAGVIGPAIRKNCPELAAALREFQKGHGLGTVFGNVVVTRYLDDNRWVRNPNAGADRRRFEQTVPFFLKYGAEYDFDALLLAAQAYQESQLNQSVRSRAGAVGVMQIKPSTAAASPIRIRGVDESVEKNIHAGVKYLRHLADDYFGDPQITPFNRHVFAIAAYNAGPTRVQQLRRKAEAQGLDPDVWFRNVELISARVVGRENVEYVRNILKYWVAYRLATQQRDDVLGELTSPS